MVPSRSRRLAFVSLVVLVVGLAPAAVRAAGETPAENAVMTAELAPLDADKLKVAKALVDAETKASPGTVLTHVLAARIAVLEARAKPTKERRTILTAALKELDEAVRIDIRDQRPWRQRVVVLQALGILEDEKTEALRAIAIRGPGDVLARMDYVNATGKVPPLKVGDPMPNVFWKDAKGQEVRSPSLWAKGPVVIELYRSAVWCPYCLAQITGMDKALDQFAEEGIEVVACSPDTQETLTEIERDGLKGRKPFRLRLLSDPKGDTADMLGVLNPDTVKPGTPADQFGLPFPTTFIVDGKGIIRFVKTHGDHRERVKPDEMLAIATRLRLEQSLGK